MKTYFVYILRCSDNSYYTGITNNLDRRIAEHREGISDDSHTHSRLPVELVFYEAFLDPKQAIAFEKQVKGWSRKKKEAIFKQNWGELKDLAVCNNRSSHLFYQKESKHTLKQ